MFSAERNNIYFFIISSSATNKTLNFFPPSIFVFIWYQIDLISRGGLCLYHNIKQIIVILDNFVLLFLIRFLTQVVEMKIKSYTKRQIRVVL